MWGYARFRKTGMIECILIRGANMTGYPTKGSWVLLKLFLSRRVIFIKVISCRVNLRYLPKHGGDEPFNGSLVAKKPAPLGRQLLLLALAEIQSPKLGHINGVMYLGIHQTRPLRDDLSLLLSDPMLSFPSSTNDGVRDDGVRKLHPGGLSHAGVVPLSVLSQGGESIKRITTTIVPKGEALCLGERPDFHARSQKLVFCSRKKCGIIVGGRR